MFSQVFIKLDMQIKNLITLAVNLISVNQNI